ISVTRTLPDFASVRAHASPAKPPPTITTCVPGAFSLMVRPSIKVPNRVARPRLQEFGDQPGPSGLVRGPDASAGVTVEVLVEVQVVAELGVRLELWIERVHLPLAGGVLQEDSDEPVRELLGHLIDREKAARAGRAFDAKAVAVVVVELLQRLDDQQIDRKPD